MKFERILVVTLSLGLLAAWAAPQKKSNRRYINHPRDTSRQTLPYRDAVLVGDTLYLAGKIGLTTDRKVPSTAEEEAKLVMDDVKKTLTEAGFSMEDLVSVQVFCSDPVHYEAFNSVYRTYFQKDFPARAFIGSGKLLFNARFEVQGIAARR